MADHKVERLPLVPTGVWGLDQILQGGLPAGRPHLLWGGAGSGKTTLGLEFVRAGARAGERVLFLTLTQTERALRESARAHGWDLAGVDIVELSQQDVAERASQQQDLFHGAAVKLAETIQAIHEALDEVQPARLVLDSIGALNTLAAGAGSHYHDELMALIRRLQKEEITAVFIQDPAANALEVLPTMMTGIVELSIQEVAYGSDQRTLRVRKMRGVSATTGAHNFAIRTGGLNVYPRLSHVVKKVQKETSTHFTSGVEGLDRLLGGGLAAGTACMLVGATGTGKTTVGTLYAYAALKRGERVAAFLFDERRESFIARATGLGMSLEEYAETGQLALFIVDTGEMSPGELSHYIRQVVEKEVAVVLFDSLTGYAHSMGREEMLIVQLHDILTYLSRRGILSLLVVAQHGMVGRNISTPVDISYMADVVLLLRNFEAEGRIRRAISVVKKRHSTHEQLIRELKIMPEGVRVGEPIMQFQGILSGHPVYTGLDEGLPASGDKEDPSGEA